MKLPRSIITKWTSCILLFYASANVFAQSDNGDSHKSVTIRNVPDSITAEMKSRKEFAYANDVRSWPKRNVPDYSALAKWIRFLNSPILRSVLYFLLTSLVIFIIYRVLAANGFTFLTARKRKLTSDETIIKEETDNIDSLIENAIIRGKYREATRYLYLKTLQSLNDSNIIKIQAKSTNHDYAAQLAGTARSDDFIRLMQTFEYVWYGEFQPDSAQFSIISNQFNHFISRI